MIYLRVIVDEECNREERKYYRQGKSEIVQKKMKTLVISLLVFCIVAVYSKQWMYDNKHMWVPGYNSVDELSLHPKLSSMHEWQDKNDQIEDKIRVQNKIDKKIEENIVRNEIDDTEDNIVPSEVKIPPIKIEDLLMSKLSDKL